MLSNFQYMEGFIYILSTFTLHLYMVHSITYKTMERPGFWEDTVGGDDGSPHGWEGSTLDSLSL